MPSWPTKLFAPSTSSSHTQPERTTTPPRLYSIFPQLDESVPTLYGHQRSKSHVPPGSTGGGSGGGLTSGSGSGGGKNIPQGGDKVDITPFGAVRRVGNGSVPEMKVGPCMTCASTVRWPTHLTVFRCTVCLGINDLVPFQKTVKTDEKGKGKQNTTPAPPPPPITVERTQAIITNCIESFLRARKSMVEGKTPRGTPTSSAASNGPRKIPRPSGNTHLMTPAPYPAFEDGRLDHNRRPSDVGNAPSHLRQLSVSVPERPGAPGMKRSVSSEASPGAVSPKTPEMAYSPRRLEQRALTERMFRPLEEYIVRSFSSWVTVETSFLKVGPDELADTSKLSGSPDKSSSTMDRAMRRQRERLRLQSPWIDWKQVADFYEAISTAGDHIAAEMFHLEEASSRNIRDEENGGNKRPFTREEAEELESDIDEARDHLERVLLKAVEHLLKRPGKPLQTPEDSRTLLVIMVCPLLHPSSAGELASSRSRAMRMRNWARTRNKPQSKSASASGGGPGQHSTIIKRVLGLISNLPNESHHFLVSWFSRLHEPDFRKLVDFSGSFITYRLTKQFGKHMTQEATQRVRGVVYADDWQIKAASKVLSLLAAANTSAALKKREADGHLENWFNANAEVLAVDSIGEGHLARQQALVRGHIIPTSDFYNSMLDYADLIADYDQWEAKSGKFSFCQYPFLLSMGSKIQILEYDAKRQMEVKAREAFFNSIGLRRTFNQYLLLRVRRDCLVEDSLKRISESVGGAGGDIKKGLKIEFEGEDGIDIGGLRKEWFLLLIRDIFDPRHGMFVYDEDSRYCYFNPHTFEATEQYFLVGVLLGMAIYNSTILDVALPPVVFKKLLSPSSTVSTPSKFSTPSPTARLPFTSTLEDLALFRPALANGLRQLLEFEGDVESTFCRDFVVEVDRYGQNMQVPLVPGGENKPVTNENKREFVDLYAQYLLDTSVARQFEPFKRGFWTVCGGNALTLFQPDEIELLVRGSDEPLDVTALRAVATYENWSTSSPHEVNLVRWFWETFESATPTMQRQLLGFITGSDRIPAMGIANMVLKLVYGGPASVHGRKKGVERYPIARTCFNSITLWGWGDKETLERVLWRAVRESEGFGLK
ncbi:putative E3 ubiquitin-protein ligase [Orbilia oligospora]|uniref:HECT-type E3 ubiquitin transferase n=1 Tax=Orbilia oligospora TaxID=2813651 RepID=A0A7C8PUT4_ORBOL|nr:putative E3 ubiquitin-protein ligase [Orbilia oligospora]TGJ66226.1 putative E3 ubiquitin-protein ligase [Orbilia oligospora]